MNLFHLFGIHSSQSMKILEIQNMIYELFCTLLLQYSKLLLKSDME